MRAAEQCERGIAKSKLASAVLRMVDLDIKDLWESPGASLEGHGLHHIYDTTIAERYSRSL